MRGYTRLKVIGAYPHGHSHFTMKRNLAAGAHTRYDVPGVLPILRGRTDELAALLDADPALLHRRYPEVDCGHSGGRLLDPARCDTAPRCRRVRFLRRHPPPPRSRR